MNYIKTFILINITIVFNSNLIFAFQKPEVPNIIVNKGHNAYVRHLFFSPDGKRIISGDFDFSVKIWDIKQKTLIKEIHNPTSAGNYGILPLADGKHYYRDTKNNISYLFDLMSGAKVRKINDESFALSDIVRHPFKNQVFACTNFYGIQGWDYGSSQLTQFTFKDAGDVTDLAINRAGTLLASFSFIGQDITIWNLASAKKLRKIAAGRDIISCSFSADSQYLAVVSDENYDLDIYNPISGKLAFYFTHESKLKHAIFHPTKPVLASCDGTYMQLWDIKTKKLVFKKKDRGSRIAFDKKGEKLASYGVDRINIWNVKTGELIQSIPFMDGKRIIGLDMDASKKLLWVNKSLGDGYLSVWDIKRKALKKTIPIWEKAEGTHPNKIVTVDKDADTFNIYDKGSAKKMFSIVNEEGKYSPGNFLINNRVMLINFGSVIKAYGLKQGKKLFALDTREDISNMTMSPDKAYFASERNYEFFIRDLNTGKKLHKVSKDFSDGFSSFCFMRESGDLLITYGDIYRWNPLKQQIIQKYASKSGDINEVRLNDDNSFLVGLAFCKLEIFQTQTSKKLSDWKMHESDIHHVSFLSNNSKLMTADGTGVIKIWDWKSRKCLGTLYMDAAKNAWVVTTNDKRYDANKEGMKYLRFRNKGSYYESPGKPFKRVHNLFAKIIE